MMCADLQTLEQTVVCTFRELFDALEYAEEHGWHQQRLVVHVFARRIWTRSIDRPYHHREWVFKKKHTQRYTFLLC